MTELPDGLLDRAKTVIRSAVTGQDVAGEIDAIVAMGPVAMYCALWLWAHAAGSGYAKLHAPGMDVELHPDPKPDMSPGERAGLAFVAAAHRCDSETATALFTAAFEAGPTTCWRWSCASSPRQRW